jgi:hypothetical protein
MTFPLQKLPRPPSKRSGELDPFELEKWYIRIWNIITATPVITDSHAEGWEAAQYDANSALLLSQMTTKPNERGDTQALNWMG